MAIIGESFKTNFLFFVFGLVLYIMWSVVISAAEDTLSKSTLPTTVVLIVQSLPYALLTTICPYFIEKFPYWTKSAVVTVLFVVGILLLSLAQQLGLKLTGIVIMSLGSGLGEITFIPLTALYDEKAVSAYFTGSGTGFFLGPFYYTGMTILGCVSPGTTLLILVALPLFIPPAYYLLIKNEVIEVSKTTEYKDIPYSPVDSLKDEENFNLTYKEKISLVRENLTQFLSLAIGMLCEYFTLQSVITTIAFQDAPFGPRDHYVIYTFVLVIGELVGRSYGLILSCIKPNIKPYTKHTWIFSVILAALMLFLLFESLYRFLASVWIVLVMVFLVGALIGALYVTAVAVTGKDETSTARREFSRAFVLGAASIGVVLAGVLGLFIEPVLRNHCEDVFMMTDFCLTRDINGWNASLSSRGL